MAAGHCCLRQKPPVGTAYLLAPSQQGYYRRYLGRLGGFINEDTVERHGHVVLREHGRTGADARRTHHLDASHTPAPQSNGRAIGSMLPSSVATSAYMASTQSKARDGDRKRDLRVIQHVGEVIPLVCGLVGALHATARVHRLVQRVRPQLGADALAPAHADCPHAATQQPLQQIVHRRVGIRTAQHRPWMGVP